MTGAGTLSWYICQTGPSWILWVPGPMCQHSQQISSKGLTCKFSLIPSGGCLLSITGGWPITVTEDDTTKIVSRHIRNTENTWMYLNQDMVHILKRSSFKKFFGKKKKKAHEAAELSFHLPHDMCNGNHNGVNHSSPFQLEYSIPLTTDTVWQILSGPKSSQSSKNFSWKFSSSFQELLSQNSQGIYFLSC